MRNIVKYIQTKIVYYLVTCRKLLFPDVSLDESVVCNACSTKICTKNDNVFSNFPFVPTHTFII